MQPDPTSTNYHLHRLTLAVEALNETIDNRLYEIACVLAFATDSRWTPERIVEDYASNPEVERSEVER